MTNIANWKIHYKWRFLAGNPSVNEPFSMAMLNNQKVLKN